VAQYILDVLGGSHSQRFYQLVAAKVPEGVIRETLSQIKVDGAQSPAKVFTYRMGEYAGEKLMRDFAEKKKGLFQPKDGSSNLSPPK
jgi:hypothetical protein